VDGWVGGRVGGWVDCSGVIIKLNSVQLQLQLPAGTELGKRKSDKNSKKLSKEATPTSKSSCPPGAPTSMIPATKDNLLATTSITTTTKSLTLTYTPSLLLNPISYPSDMFLGCLTQSNIATDTSTFPAFQEKDNHFNFSLPDSMQDDLLSPSTMPAPLNNINSNMDIQVFSTSFTTPVTSSPLIASRPLSTHTPPGTPPTPARPLSTTSLACYFPQSSPEIPWLQDSSITSTTTSGGPGLDGNNIKTLS
jgi:hypothetical protein